MKRFSLVAGLALLLGLAGCASLPARRVLKPAEESMGLTAFRQLAAVQKNCGRGADAEVTLSLDSLWKSGSLPGDLQLMAPGYLRFVGLNPLGQPLLIIATDGRSFSSILPAEMRGYEGKLTAPSIRRYVPEGWRPVAGYYWLIGRLQPGAAKVLEVAGAASGSDLWVKLTYDEGTGMELVRFDPDRLTVSRHQLLDERGKVVLDVEYGDYAGSPCALPGLVTIRSGRRNGTLQLKLQDWRTDQALAPPDFNLVFPPGFKRIKIP